MSIVEPEVAESTGGDAPQTSVKSPEPSYQQLSQAQGKYKRNYRACLNCRLRKVKCDLGPVDNPTMGNVHVVFEKERTVYLLKVNEVVLQMWSMGNAKATNIE